jgi:hypothetical protein
VLPRRHGGNRFRLVVLDADQHAARRQHVAHDGGALEDRLGAFAHQHVVAGDEGFAFGTVEHQGIEPPLLAGVELQVAGKHRAAETDDAGVAQVVARLVGVGAEVEGLAFDPFVAAVRFDDHAQRRKPEVCGIGAFRRRHGTGGRGMDRRRDIAIGAADALALEHALARLTRGRGGPPMLWCSGITSPPALARRRSAACVDASLW